MTWGHFLTVEPPIADADQTEPYPAARPAGMLSGGPIVFFRRAARQAGYLIEIAALVVLLLFFACLPVDRASGLGGFIGRTIGPRTGASRRAFRNLSRAMPENGDAENHRILRGMWDNLGRTMAEYPHLARICAFESGRVDIVNGEGLRALMNDGIAGIVFGGHLSNWEIAPVTLHPLFGPSLISVYRAANNPWVDRLLQRLRHSPDAVAKGAAGGREVLRHLRQGGHLAMFVDQKMNDGIAVPFFGRDAMTAPALARLALRFNCPIVPVRVERLQGARFRFTVLPPLAIAAAGETTATVLATMTRVNAMLEDWIRARPEQWLWVHRRWPD